MIALFVFLGILLGCQMLSQTGRFNGLEWTLGLNFDYSIWMLYTLLYGLSWGIALVISWGLKQRQRARSFNQITAIDPNAQSPDNENILLADTKAGHYQLLRIKGRSAYFDYLLIISSFSLSCGCAAFGVVASWFFFVAIAMTIAGLDSRHLNSQASSVEK